MNRVKGIALRRNTDYILENYGRAALEALCRTLFPETARTMLEGPIKSTWYDVEIYFDQLRGIAARFGDGEPSKIMQTLGAYSAEMDLNSIYRFFLKFGNPGFVIGQGAVMWKNYYDGGQLEIVVREPKRVCARLIDDRTLPFNCDLILGWAGRAIELSGGKDVRSLHSACRHRGDATCDFEGTWR